MKKRHYKLIRNNLTWLNLILLKAVEETFGVTVLSTVFSTVKKENLLKTYKPLNKQVERTAVIKLRSEAATRLDISYIFCLGNLVK